MKHLSQLDIPKSAFQHRTFDEKENNWAIFETLINKGQNAIPSYVGDKNI